MKYLIVCTVSFLFVIKINAQSNKNKDSLSNLLQGRTGYIDKKSFMHKYGYLFSNKLNATSKKIQLYTSPKTIYGSVLKLPEPTLTYIGKVNHSNIYQATPDKMYVIKPDSTIVLN